MQGSHEGVTLVIYNTIENMARKSQSSPLTCMQIWLIHGAMREVRTDKSVLLILLLSTINSSLSTI